METTRQYWFIFQNDYLLLVKENEHLPDDLSCAHLKPDFLRHFESGCWQDKAYCCAEIAPDYPIPDNLYPLPLRQALLLFSDEMYGLAAKAWSVINWDRNHQFCSACGKRTEYRARGFERFCPTCKLSFFPRISPSIIVLVSRGDELLMARSPHFAPGIFGLIAGFVEAGESIEEAVHREVKEEVGLLIRNLVYQGSQSWPFPDSLMLAFTADYASGDIIMDRDEIEDAGWYRHDQLPGRPSLSNSIAWRLIDEFVGRYNPGL